jgi:hypothetical protein
MKKISVVLLLMLIDILSFVHLASGKGPEKLIYVLPSGMEPKFVQDYDYGSVYMIRFVMQGNSIDDWTEVFEVVNAMKSNYPKNPLEMYNQTVEKRKMRCQNAECSIINQTPESIIYEIKTKKCPPFPDEYSINRVLYGKTNVFLLIYTSRKPELLQKTRDEWMGILSKAHILP